MLACLARKESALSMPQDPTSAQVSTPSFTTHASTETGLQVTDDNLSRRDLELSLKKSKAVGHSDPVPAQVRVLRGS